MTKYKVTPQPKEVRRYPSRSTCSLPTFFRPQRRLVQCDTVLDTRRSITTHLTCQRSHGTRCYTYLCGRTARPLFRCSDPSSILLSGLHGFPLCLYSTDSTIQSLLPECYPTLAFAWLLRPSRTAEVQWMAENTRRKIKQVILSPYLLPCHSLPSRNMLCFRHSSTLVSATANTPWKLAPRVLV